jgi:adenine deaminase
LKGETTTPLRIFRQVSHKIPGNGPDIELGGVSMSTAELCERVSQANTATLGESNPFSLDLASAQKQAAALHAGKRITGHTALLENEPLWAYAAGGIGDVSARLLTVFNRYWIDFTNYIRITMPIKLRMLLRGSSLA